MVGTLGWRSAPAQSSLGIDALQRLRIVAATVEKEDGRRGASIEGAPAFVLRAAGAVCHRSIEHTLHGHIGSHRDRAGSDRRRRRSAASRGQSGCSRSRKARGGVGARAGCVPAREVGFEGGGGCSCVRSGGGSGAAESRWGGKRRRGSYFKCQKRQRGEERRSMRPQSLHRRRRGIELASGKCPRWASGSRGGSDGAVMASTLGSTMLVMAPMVMDAAVVSKRAPCPRIDGGGVHGCILPFGLGRQAE